MAGNHWLRLSPSVALLKGQVWSSLGIRCQQQQLVDWTCRSNRIFPATDLASLLTVTLFRSPSTVTVTDRACTGLDLKACTWLRDFLPIFPKITVRQTVGGRGAAEGNLKPCKPFSPMCTLEPACKVHRCKVFSDVRSIFGWSQSKYTVCVDSLPHRKWKEI